MNKKATYQAKVLNCRKETEDTDVFILELMLQDTQNFTVKPGQFVVLYPQNNTSVMPRPFSIVKSSANYITMLIKVVGANTKAYSQLKFGNKIIVSGPHGKGIPIDAKPNYILVGGGIGGAGLVLLAITLARMHKKFYVLLGAKNKKQIAGISFFENYYPPANKIITEEGTGETGLVTDLLESILKKDLGKSKIITCGPDKMLYRVSEMSKQYGNECQVILEELMACGVGSCKGCAVKGVDNTIKHICTDGPAFDAEWVDWQKIIPKLELKSLVKTKFALVVSEENMIWDYPIMNSSGCVGIEALESGKIDYSKMGALVTKGVTLYARQGNKMPRVCETPSGMINSIGLENIGAEEFIKNELPRWLSFGKPVIVNIAGSTIKEYKEIALLLKGIDDIAGIEINISCPNVEEGGMAFGTDANIAYEVVESVRECVKNKFLIVKLTPNVTDIVKIAKSVVFAGADAISLVNTVQAMAIDVATRRPKIRNVFGGLSGSAIRPMALYKVYQLAQADLGFPIIGMGGIDSGVAAAEFFMAGATAIAVGTGTLSNPNIFSLISDELEQICKSHQFKTIQEMIGSMLIEK